MWNFAYPYKLKQLIDLSSQRNMLFTFDGENYGPLLKTPWARSGMGKWRRSFVWKRNPEKSRRSKSFPLIVLPTPVFFADLGLTTRVSPKPPFERRFSKQTRLHSSPSGLFRL